MKKCIVTGAAGFTGCNLVERLLAAGYFVYCVVRKNSAHNTRLENLANVQMVYADLAEYKNLHQQIQGPCEVFFHLAWQGGRYDFAAQYQPDAMGVEQLFFNRNVDTAIPVGQARGVILLTSAKNNLRLIERTPLQVKQSVTGYGKATKEQVIYMVTKILNLPKPPKPDDVADALAVAICTSHMMNSFTFRNNL